MFQVYDPESEDKMKEVVEEISVQCGVSGVNLLYTCPDWFIVDSFYILNTFRIFLWSIE